MSNTLAPVLAVALSAAASVAAQGAPIPADSSWEQVHYTRIHGWCMATGFLIILPLGSITARYLRAYLPFQRWLSAHALVQLLALPIICTGFGVGVHVAKYNGQFLNPHTKIGLTLFLMYWIQLALGIVTAATPSVAMGSAKPRAVQPDTRHPMRARPWYALLHAFWGTSMIVIASVQVRRGYTIEWPMKRGQKASGPGWLNGCGHDFHAWVIGSNSGTSVDFWISVSAYVLGGIGHPNFDQTAGHRPSCRKRQELLRHLCQRCPDPEGNGPPTPDTIT